MKAGLFSSISLRKKALASAVFLACFTSLSAYSGAAYAAPAQSKYKCAALLKVKETALPEWYKEEIKTQAKVFFEKLFELNPQAPLDQKNKYDGLTKEQQKHADYVHSVLIDQKKWREFTISMAIELAQILNKKGILKEGAWYSDPPSYGSPTETLMFVREKVNPELRKLLRSKLKEHGFTKFTTVKSALDDAVLMKIFAAGKIFWDDAFIDSSHGSETHALQALFISEELDKKFGAGTGFEFYKLMGTEVGYRIFGDYLDAVNGTIYQPEQLNPVLSLVLPQR